MSHSSKEKRIDTASRVILASSRTIYEAFVNPEALVKWLPPRGMKGHIYEFNAQTGGVYHMSLTYVEANHTTVGKTSENADVVRGRFLKLVPYERIVQSVEFESEDPMYEGEMTMTWILTTVPEGTEVTIICENVPPGILKEDHDMGLRSSLENLANFVE